jgi:16S rRNA (guanine966-N2)-methyltransferase
VRIVAGEWRGRTIRAPAGRNVRPTLDRVREAWMSILQTDLPGARVLDLFAGSGALALEALSRGAAHADLVDDSARSLEVIRANVATLGAADRVRVVRADALKFVASLSVDAYDVALADPPYASEAPVLLAQRWLESPFATVLAIEHRRDAVLPGDPDVRRYGDSSISFYR